MKNFACNLPSGKNKQSTIYLIKIKKIIKLLLHLLIKFFTFVCYVEFFYSKEIFFKISKIEKN